MKGSNGAKEAVKYSCELYMVVAAYFKMVPFQFERKAELGQRYRTISRWYEWAIFYIHGLTLFLLTGYRIWSFTIYVSQVPTGLITVLYALYVGLNVAGAVLFLNDVLFTEELAQMLNTVEGAEREELFGNSGLYDDKNFQGMILGGNYELVSYILMWGCGLPMIVSEIPWFVLPAGMARACLMLPLKTPILSILVETCGIMWIMILLMAQVWIPALSGMRTLSLWRDHLKRTSSETNDTVMNYKEFQLLSRVCNNWWSIYYFPVIKVIFFIFLVWGMYSTAVLYHKNVPLYIYWICPTMAVYGIMAAVQYYTPLALIEKDTERLCLQTYRVRRKSSEPALGSHSEETDARRVHAHHVVNVARLSERHKFTQLKPTGIESGGSGDFVTLETALRVIEEAINYALLLIVLESEA